MGIQQMAKAPTKKKKAAKRSVTKAKVSPSAPKQIKVAKKNSFEANFGEIKMQDSAPQFPPMNFGPAGEA